MDDVAEPAVRLRERTVTDGGTLLCLADRGDARGGLLAGPGSFDRTLCTRASSRLIFSVRVRMCDSELEAGSL